MKVETRLIPTVEIWPNTGQIPGLPKNPRLIRDERHEALVKSIQDDPEMLDLRECIVFPYAAAYVAIAGNMRLAATSEVVNMDAVAMTELMARKKQKQKENGLDYDSWLDALTKLRATKSIPCKVLSANTPVEKLKAITIKDNVGFGQDDWDLLKADWDRVELEDFGMIMMDFESEEPEDEKEPKVSAVKFSIVFDDLQVYDTVRVEVEELLKSYPGAKIKE